VASQEDDTVKTVRDVIHDACKIAVLPKDIQSAVRLRSRSAGLRPILVSFTSIALRSDVLKARRPKKKLTYDGSILTNT
jgi:hypothetical protein